MLYWIMFFLLICSFSGITEAANVTAPTKAVYVGIFREGAPSNMNYIKKYVEEVGKKPACIMWYEDWNQPFPLEDAQNVIAFGAIPHVVWEPWYWGDHGKVVLKDIIAGKWDAYISTWAKEAKAFGKPIFVRMAHEFNIDGYPWGIIHNDKDPQVYVKAFRHVVDIFKREGASNVKFVWCFMNYSFPDESWNDWAAAYPGDNYVDWIGIDGYNWGNTQSWSQWQVFKYLFRDQVRRAKGLWPNKPIMIAEFASAEKGGNKAAWTKELPGYLKSSMQDIDMIIWFDLKKETDWRIKSSPESLKAYQAIMKDPIFSSSAEGLAKLTVSPPKLIKREHKIACAVKAPAPIKIDGNLSGWNKTAPLTMKDARFFREGTTWSGPADLSGVIYVNWDENFLYIAADVTDKIPLVNSKERSDIWNGDAIEMVLGLDGGADYQIGFGTGDGKGNPPTIWNWQRRRTPEGSEIKVIKKDAKGYLLEAKLPWAFFRGKFTPTKGAKIGFDIAIDDADYTGERERQFIWNGDYYFYRDPSVWGTLEFK
ncbi:MAG: sugar-binding protein [Candidatus Margulisbacteria bacterium]|nr:sugar-binding protein [Candidatus Margulisiibacteriota bacterium]